MSVLVENEFGWIVDHQQEINKTYAVTYIFEKYRLSDFISQRHIAYQFRAVPELFAIHRRYMMDSQFTKSVKINLMSNNSDLVAQGPDVTRSDHTCELACKSLMPDVQPARKSKVNIFFCFLTFFCATHSFFICNKSKNIQLLVEALIILGGKYSLLFSSYQG